ncbi:hypothetical protein KR018_009198 [Drosophila ironensis]|nr:hypothetical protein KR018_009198 [Drosophila ironensis]
MQSVQTLPLAVLAVLAVMALALLADAAPENRGRVVLPVTLVGFDFPAPGDQVPQESPEPRVVENIMPILVANSGLTPSQILARAALPNDSGRNFFKHFFKENSSAPASIIVNTTVTTGEPATTTTTRLDDVLRTPMVIPYPVALPFQGGLGAGGGLGYSSAIPQFFRQRQDQSPAISYPSALFGWNEASILGGQTGMPASLPATSGLSNLISAYTNQNGAVSGGLTGGLPGVPLVPITVGNEVRYVPLNIRMLRQLPTGPTIRENEDNVEEADDISPFAALEPQLAAEQASDQENLLEAAPGFGMLGQRFRQRRRRPLQSLAQNIRRVQFLKR